MAAIDDQIIQAIEQKRLENLEALKQAERIKNARVSEGGITKIRKTRKTTTILERWHALPSSTGRQDEDEEEEPEKCYKCGGNLGVLGQCVTCGKIPDACDCDRNRKRGDDEDKDDKDKEEPEEDSESEGKGIEASEGAEAAEGAEAGAAAAEGAEAAEAGAATTGFLAATSEIWVPALVIILGVALVFGLVVFIFTGMVAGCNQSGLTGFAIRAGSKVGSWVGVLSSDVCAQLAINPSQTIVVNPSEPRPPTGGMTDSEARRLLANANTCNYPLGWARADCVNASEPQTSLGGIQIATLNEVIRFKVDCDLWARNNGGGICEVVVSGGTETTGGHEGGPCSHLSGNKVDIRPTTLISRYIRTTFTRTGSRGSDPQYKNSAGISYVDEGNHWDIGGVGCT